MTPATAKPCLLCGTTGGTVQLGRARPRRVHGLCNRCLRLNGKPPRQAASRARRPQDPTPWQIAVAALAIRWEATGQARRRFRAMERSAPVGGTTYRLTLTT